MSRSYKKAVFTDHGAGTKIDKRLASKAVRHTRKLDSGGSHKKAYCSWDICDWKIDCRFDPDTKIVKDRHTGEFVEKPTYIASYLGAKKTKAGWIIPK